MSFQFQVFKIAYCSSVDLSMFSEFTRASMDFVFAVRQHRPEMLKKTKSSLATT